MWRGAAGKVRLLLSGSAADRVRSPSREQHGDPRPPSIHSSRPGCACLRSHWVQSRARDWRRGADSVVDEARSAAAGARVAQRSIAGGAAGRRRRCRLVRAVVTPARRRPPRAEPSRSSTGSRSIFPTSRCRRSPGARWSPSVDGSRGRRRDGAHRRDDRRDRRAAAARLRRLRRRRRGHRLGRHRRRTTICRIRGGSAARRRASSTSSTGSRCRTTTTATARTSPASSRGNGFDSGGARSGIAPAAHLIVLKVLDGNGHGRISDVIAALDYVVANKDALEHPRRRTCRWRRASTSRTTPIR